MPTIGDIAAEMALRIANSSIFSTGFRPCVILRHANGRKV